jgi:L-alanine-DL-glutamate epimerase-like enolase superfamily enzyme
MPVTAIDAQEQSWPLDKPFRIGARRDKKSTQVLDFLRLIIGQDFFQRGSSGRFTETRVVVVTVTDGRHTGRGEAAPIRRYNQSPASVLTQIESIKSVQHLDRQRIQKLLPAGAARNALDCAFWDLEAKISGKRAWELANIPLAHEVTTSFTISLDTPAAMAAAAKANATAPILKLKLGGDDPDLARVKAVREAAPAARLLVDANESWTSDHYCKVAPSLRQFGVELIEQPFPADADEVLETLDHPIPICADESCHTTADLPRLKNRYEMVNVKLDKTGGLTEALFLSERAREAGFKLLIGCMVCTSLGIAPARLLASAADYVDLDSPLILAGDRHHAVPYDNGRIGIPPRELWG